MFEILHGIRNVVPTLNRITAKQIPGLQSMSAMPKRCNHLLLGVYNDFQEGHEYFDMFIC